MRVDDVDSFPLQEEQELEPGTEIEASGAIESHIPNTCLTQRIVEDPRGRASGRTEPTLVAVGIEPHRDFAGHALGASERGRLVDQCEDTQLGQGISRLGNIASSEEVRRTGPSA